MTKVQCSGDSRIAGASFTLSPMCDDFVDIILGTLEDVDSSKVWMETDDVTTTARGKIVHVFDVTKAICVRAVQTGEHVSFQATFSIGCPGDADTDAYMALDDVPANEALWSDVAVENSATEDDAEVDRANVNRYAAAKFSLYPLGGGNYMDVIYGQIEAMKEFVEVTPAHYSTKLAGGIVDIFTGLENAFRATVEGGSSHAVMTVSVSMNSPSHEKTE